MRQDTIDYWHGPLLYGLKLEGYWFVFYDSKTAGVQIAGGPYVTREEMLDGMKIVRRDWDKSDHAA